MWSAGAQKGRERVQLELVCRRFQVLVRASGCLKWSFRSPTDEGAFLSHMLESKPYALRVALDVGAPINVMAILQSVLLLADDTLEEVHLFLERPGLEGHTFNWTYVFLMFAALKGLRTLDIHLWGRKAELHNLEVIRLGCFSKPFAKLSSLTLHGFTISGPTFNASIKTLPALKDLEVSQFTGQASDLKAYALEKVFIYGNQGVGFDSKSPGRVGLPRSLGKVVGLLQHRSSAVRGSAARILLDLSNSPENQKAILRVSGCLQKLVTLFGDVSAVEPATKILHKLAGEPSNQELIAKVPGCLQHLLSLLEGPNPNEHEAAGRTLASLVGNAPAGEHIAQEPGFLERLVGLLDNRLGRAGEWSAWVLCCFLRLNPEQTSSVAQVQGCFQKLGALLESSGLCESSSSLLLYLCNDGATPKLVASTPGFLESIVIVLASKQVEAQRRSLSILRILSQDIDCRKEMLDVPKCWRSLVRIVERGGGNEQMTAARVIWQLAAYEAYLQTAGVEGSEGVKSQPCSSGEDEHESSGKERLRESCALAKERVQGDSCQVVARSSSAGAKPLRCLRGLTKVLRHGGKGVRKILLQVLWASFEDSEGSKAPVYEAALQVPGVVPGLMDLLSDAEPLSVRKEAIGALQSLATFPEARATMANLAGCLDKLVELMGSEEGCLRTLAAFTLAELAIDPSHCGIVKKLPGAVEKIVTILDERGGTVFQEVADQLLHSLQPHLPSLLSVDAMCRHLQRPWLQSNAASRS